MATKTGLLNTSVAKKAAMALSGLFLVVFLLQHVSINSLSVLSPDRFNEVSHFMGNNILVQFLLQPVLIIGVLFHFIMGFALEAKNRSARNVKYAYSRPETNSSWMSRNMIITGIMVLLFLGLHFYDFWVPEISTKYIQGDISGLAADGGYRYYHELVEKFHDPIRVAIYVVAFVFLALHLQHGFKSAFQSVGMRNATWTPIIAKASNIFAFGVPAIFALIAIIHFLAH